MMKDALDKYKEEMIQYKASLSDFELDQLDAERKSKREARRKKKDKKASYVKRN